MLARRIRPVLIAVLLAATGMLLLACSSDDRAPEGTATVEQGELSGAESTTSPTPIATVTPPLTPPPSSAELAANAVVRVDVLIAGSVVANGSGTAIGDGRHVLTNHHVVDAGNAYEVVLEGMGGVTTTAPAEVVLFNETMDLAMLRLPSSLGVPLELAEEAPASGQSVLIAGYPDIGGSTLTVTRGTVSGFNDFGDGLGRVWIKTDATISFGNSGGAAIDDAGRLVGVPTGVMSDGVGGIGYLLGSTAAADFVAAGLVSDGLPAPQRPVVTGDPFEFCALVDTADLRFSNHGDVQYVGPDIPFRDSSGWILSWRCWDGQVLICSPGASLFPCGIVDDSGIPSDWLLQHCFENPSDPHPPMGAVGHMNAFDFACIGGEPVIVGRVFEPGDVDSLGYLFGVWDLATP